MYVAKWLLVLFPPFFCVFFSLSLYICSFPHAHATIRISYGLIGYVNISQNVGIFHSIQNHLIFCVCFTLIGICIHFYVWKNWSPFQFTQHWSGTGTFYWLHFVDIFAVFNKFDLFALPITNMPIMLELLIRLLLTEEPKKK